MCPTFSFVVFFMNSTLWQILFDMDLPSQFSTTKHVKVSAAQRDNNWRRRKGECINKQESIYYYLTKNIGTSDLYIHLSLKFRKKRKKRKKKKNHFYLHRRRRKVSVYPPKTKS